mgnify:CR=1 FL=1
MATSSILENIRVNNPKVVEEFIVAMEDFEKNPLEFDEKKSTLVTDSVRLRAIVEKGLKKRGDA